MSSLSGNLLVAQSGGPTPVINASLAGVIAEALNHEDEIVEILGGLNGIQGILHEQLIDLAEESQQTLRNLEHTPGAALLANTQPPCLLPGKLASRLTLPRGISS